MISSVYFPSSTHVFSMKGRDARDFLHRLSTVNVRDMEIGRFKPGFLLNPQGKIHSVFRIAAFGPDEFLLEVEGGRGDEWKARFLAILDQFTFAEEYRLEEKVGWKNAWLFALPDALEDYAEMKGELLYLHGARETFESPWTSAWGPREAIDSFLSSRRFDLLSEEEFERRRIRCLFPRVDRELVPEANPLELGMRSAIDDGKGCYPGQEVIEKIISIGSPAKRLARIDADATVPVGAKIFLDDGKTEVGTTTSVAPDGDAFIALTLLRKNALEVGRILKIASRPETGKDAKNAPASDADAYVTARVGRIARYE